MEYVIQIAFKSSRHKFIQICEKSARWSNKEYTSGIAATEAKLMVLINSLIKNSYFHVGNTVLRQQIGIPMGTNAAPQLADLFLLGHELRYIKSCLANDYSKAMNLRYVFRYLDDITVINDKGMFIDEYKNIYSESLDLSHVNQSSAEADVLDINIKIVNKRFETTVFDKRRSFNFPVNQLPAIDSNISVELIYNIVYSQLVRIARICSKPKYFFNNVNILFVILITKGYSKRKLKATFIKFVKNNTRIYNHLQLNTANEAWKKLACLNRETF
jgi:hypothetical protein